MRNEDKQEKSPQEKMQEGLALFLDGVIEILSTIIDCITSGEQDEEIRKALLEAGVSSDTAAKLLEKVRGMSSD